MYDILQLNDMLVPELLDIAEHRDITDASRLDKQELIYRILDKQALTPAAATNGAAAEKPKRKRTVKASTANTTEEAEVMTEAPKKLLKETKSVSKDKNTKEEKPKRARAKSRPEEEEGSEPNQENTTSANTDEYMNEDESLT